MVATPVFIGIDVACARGKRLPICFASHDVLHGGRLTPHNVSKLYRAEIPRGLGNEEITRPEPFVKCAADAAKAIGTIVDKLEGRVVRIAIDAPALAPATPKRASEQALAARGLPYFWTPSTLQWPQIERACECHWKTRRDRTTFPHANKIWMLYGFALFAKLRSKFDVEVIETYPFAVVREFLATGAHKSTDRGYEEQLKVIARHTGWEPAALHRSLATNVPGTQHDRLDAFMAAWVASLPREQRRAYGNPENLDDSIWVPDASRLPSTGHADRAA